MNIVSSAAIIKIYSTYLMNFVSFTTSYNLNSHMKKEVGRPSDLSYFIIAIAIALITKGH